MSRAALEAQHHRVTLPVTDGALRLAIVADTHSQPHPNTRAWLEAQAPVRILHAGDIGALSVLDELAEVAPVLAVRGNIDERAHELPDLLTIDLVDGGRRLLRILLLHIAVNGPRLRGEAVARAEAEEASLVICGHSHVPFIGRDRGLVIFNPGSVGPRRFALPIVFGVLELKAGRVTMHHVDCESGARWTP